VLDPVAVGVLGFRGLLARELLNSAPTVVRGNASEILSLSGAIRGGKGVDSTAKSEAALASAMEFAQKHGHVVAVSGAVDYITDGDVVIAVPGGDPMMSQVTGVGCVLGALISAFLAVNPEPLTAAASASAVFAAAGERAARGAVGPGTFAVRLLDELHVLTQTAKEATA
jgi:hydroxyethylthiazole kinase